MTEPRASRGPTSAIVTDGSPLGNSSGGLAVLDCVALAVATGAGAQALDLTPSVNARYGFALLVPKGFRADPPPVNGDGRSFASPDGSVMVNGSGHLLDRRGDMAAEFQRRLGFEKQDGPALTYSRATGMGFT